MNEQSKEYKQAAKAFVRHRDSINKRQERTARRDAALDIDGNRLVDSCSYCGAVSKIAHKHRTNMCQECGKLYERWRKAVRENIQTELRLLKPKLLQRARVELTQDITNTHGITKFYNKVKNTEVTEMKVSNITHKVCRQCGRDMPIEMFRQYPPRGKGIYQTTQSHYTICKDCESISNRVAALQRKEFLTEADKTLVDKLREHYKTLESRGLPPRTAAARRLLYGADAAAQSQPDRASLEDLLASVQGAGESMSMSTLKDAAALEREETDLERHCRKVRTRAYGSFEEAEIMHESLVYALKSAGLYEEINNLMDEWYMEG